jgi:hypothetical protein
MLALPHRPSAAEEVAQMMRLFVQAILYVSGLLAAVFIRQDDPGFPVYSLIVALLGFAIVAVGIWYLPYRFWTFPYWTIRRYLFRK